MSRKVANYKAFFLVLARLAELGLVLIIFQFLIRMATALVVHTAVVSDLMVRMMALTVLVVYIASATGLVNHVATVT